MSSSLLKLTQAYSSLLKQPLHQNGLSLDRATNGYHYKMFGTGLSSFSCCTHGGFCLCGFSTAPLPTRTRTLCLCPLSASVGGTCPLLVSCHKVASCSRTAPVILYNPQTSTLTGRKGGKPIPTCLHLDIRFGLGQAKGVHVHEVMISR